MQNDPLKIQALKTAMRNPRMSKLIMDAVKSPVGSSKRESAKGVINSLHMAQRNKQQKSMPSVIVMDSKGRGPTGQGGPIQTYLPPSPLPTPEYLSLKPINVSYYTFKAPVQPTPEPVSVKPPMFGGQGGGLPGNTGYVNPLPLPNINKSLGIDYSNPNPTPPPTPTIPPVSAIPSVTAPKPSPTPTIPPSLPSGQYNGSAVGTMFTAPNVHGTPPPTTPKPTPVATTTTPVVSPITNSPTTPNVSSPYGPGLDSSGKSTLPPTSSGSPLGDYILGKYQSGAGPLETYLGVANDSKKLQELFPGVPLSDIPVGSSLAGQLNDLQDSLKKEFKITQLGDALNSAVTQGTTIQSDVTAYIRGKDEFLSSVDKMLKGANDQYINSSSHGDPFYEKSMKQYTDYLTTLKGRATQNYIDYLNTSINYQNGQVQQLQTAYNKAADLVNQTYTQKAALTTEQYNFVKDTITEMYNNVAQRGGLLTNMSTQTMDYYNNQAIMINNVLSHVLTGATKEARQVQLDKFDPTGKLSGLVDVNSTASTGSFSDTQTNSGAANANLPISEFKVLNGDVQNYYIANNKNSDGVTFSDWINNSINEIKDGKTSLNDTFANVESSNFPQVVKDYVKQKMKEVSTTASSGGGWGWIKKIRKFLNRNAK